METELIIFTAPTGARIFGAEQDSGQFGWEVIWDCATNPNSFADYAGDGPGIPDWETVTLRDQVAWIDDDNDSWLSRHLIPAGAVPLSEEAVALAQRDYFAALASCTAEGLVTSLEVSARRGKVGEGRLSPVAVLIRNAQAIARDCAEQAASLTRAWAAMLAHEQSEGRGIRRS